MFNFYRVTKKFEERLHGGWTMSIREIEPFLEKNKGSEVLKKQFDDYCDWCWGHGFGKCTTCKKIFHKYYIPIRKRELQVKLGLVK